MQRLFTYLNPVSIHNPMYLVNRYCMVSIALLVLIMVGNVAHADVSAEVDRTTLAVNTPLYLTVRATNEDANFSPDFAPLQAAFSLGQISQGTELSIINGRSQTTRTWTLPIVPKNAGSIEIPSLTVGSKFTDVIQLTVTSATTAAPTGNTNAATGTDVQVRVGLSRLETWVGAPVIYTTKIYSKRRIDRGTITDPQPTDATNNRLSVQNYGQDQQYQVTENGLRWMVRERRYLITPSKTGEYTIPGVVLSASLASRGMRGIPVETISDALTLTVLPQPSDYPADKDWLPLKNLTISETWSPEPLTFRAGEPVTRTITMQAESFDAITLDDLDIPTPPGFKVYPGETVATQTPTGEHITNTVDYTFLLLPEQAGDYTLPAIELPWFDVNSGETKLATLPAQAITVEPSVGLPASPVAPTPSTSDVNPTSNQWLIWAGLAGLFAALWVSTVLAWFITARRRNKIADDQRVEGNIGITQLDTKTALAELEHQSKAFAEVDSKADEQHQSIHKLRNAVIVYVRSRLPASQTETIHSLDDVVAAAGHDYDLWRLLTTLQSYAYGQTSANDIDATERSAYTKNLRDALVSKAFNSSSMQTNNQPESPLQALNPI